MTVITAEMFAVEPRAVRPPFDRADDQFDGLASADPHGWRRAVHLDRVAALREPLDGLELSRRESATLEWLAGWGVPTVAAVVALLHRARAAAPLGEQPETCGCRVTGPLLTGSWRCSCGTDWLAGRRVGRTGTGS